MNPSQMNYRGLTVAACLFALGSLAPRAHAGGMFFSARGARPLGRAGAFVAGADDLESIYYNPAGLAGTGDFSAMLDVGIVLQGTQYDRVDSGGNRQPTADDDNGIIPIPTLGVSWRPSSLGHRVTFGLAAFAPYSGVSNYSPTGAQRYSLVSINGTAIVVAELAVSIRLTAPSSEAPQIYLGFGFQNAFTRVANVIALSGCTELNCAPEDPNFDTLTQARVTSLFTPTGNVGALFVSRYLRAGASFQLPTYIRASGTITAKLPKDHQFDGATVNGNALDVEFNLPWVARAGVEGRPSRQLRVELAATYEAWSMQDKIKFIPRGVYLDHVAGIGRYDLGPMSLNRSMQDSIAIALGGEYDLADRLVTLRAGYLYETSAVPDQTMSVLTPDGDKHVVTLGASLRLGRYRIDAGYGHVFQGDRTITNSESYQLNPIRPDRMVAIGNGTYRVSMDIVSLGIEGRF